MLTSALRTFENQMIERTTSKVLASREACQLLYVPPTFKQKHCRNFEKLTDGPIFLRHNSNFLIPEWQSKRKSVVPDMLERVARMSREHVTASSSPIDLDRGAFLETTTSKTKE